MIEKVKHITRTNNSQAMLLGLLLATGHLAASEISPSTSNARLRLGQTLFSAQSLSADGATSCESCHDPTKAYADGRKTSIGVNGKGGTRNAPSLIGISDNRAFFWDGRRDRLEDAVVDAFTNPVELGLRSSDDLIQRIKNNADLSNKFRLAFPDAIDVPTMEQAQAAIAQFVRSLTASSKTGNAFGSARPDVLLGKRLFDGVAACTECHSSVDDRENFSDGKYHHSSVSSSSLGEDLPALVRSVIEQSLSLEALGPKILIDARWSSLGRFVITQRPSDIGVFRTPSLRNVAVTAPYMHDGSIATLDEAVDHELFYRSFSRGHPVNLSLQERKALVAYVATLTDFQYSSEPLEHSARSNDRPRTPAALTTSVDSKQP